VVVVLEQLLLLYLVLHLFQQQVEQVEQVTWEHPLQEERPGLVFLLILFIIQGILGELLLDFQVVVEVVVPLLHQIFSIQLEEQVEQVEQDLLFVELH
jgi:hypothetical protein